MLEEVCNWIVVKTYYPYVSLVRTIMHGSNLNHSQTVIFQGIATKYSHMIVRVMYVHTNGLDHPR